MQCIYDLTRQTRYDQTVKKPSKMAVKDKWLLNWGQFTININEHLGSQIMVFKKRVAAL